MREWSRTFVAGALGATLPEGGPFSSVSTDTRTLEPGALFVALSGERFDGHDHLGDALTRGAAAAVVRTGTPAVAGLPLVEVASPLEAYGALAHARRKEIAGPVIAVTGTNGKTSTKEMLRAVLATRYQVHATHANLNNLVGVPYTILSAPEGTEALVVEAGANLPGEISRYREIIDPDITVITNAGAGHLEGFGSPEGVLNEKLALARDVALAIVGTDPPALADGARHLARRVLTAGINAAERKARDLTLDQQGRASFMAGDEAIQLPYPGRHLAANAMLAWAVAEELGLDLHASARALGSVTLPSGRTELTQLGLMTVLNDCYNANPQSFASAIASARAMREGRRLVFVAGTMRELGSASAQLHAEVADQLVALKPDLLAAVGEFVAPLEARREAFAGELLTAADPLALGPILAPHLAGDELVVLKASRGVALERILPLLRDRALPAAEA
jgi:UDP-N-acetylmuramoyl-tripeptide--D-alanyl-D-alanine ligase